MTDLQDTKQIEESADTLAINQLQAAVLDGLNSGPAEPLDMEAIISEARTARSQRK